MGGSRRNCKSHSTSNLQPISYPHCCWDGTKYVNGEISTRLDAKKTGFAKWTYDDGPTKLWPVRPLSAMWGIGKQMEIRLNNTSLASVI